MSAQKTAMRPSMRPPDPSSAMSRPRTCSPSAPDGTGSLPPLGSWPSPKVMTPFVPIVISVSTLPYHGKPKGSWTWNQPSSLFCSQFVILVPVSEISTHAKAKSW